MPFITIRNLLSADMVNFRVDWVKFHDSHLSFGWNSQPVDDSQEVTRDLLSDRWEGLKVDDRWSVSV